MFLSATWGKRRRNCILTLTHSLRLVSLFRCKFDATQLLLLVFYLAYFWILLMYSILPEKGCSCIECLMLLSSFFPMGIWQYFALLQGMLLFIYFFLSSEHSTIWKSSMVTPHPLNSHLTPSCSDQWTCNWRHRLNQATDWGLLTPLRNEFFLQAENTVLPRVLTWPSHRSDVESFP